MKTNKTRGGKTLLLTWIKIITVITVVHSVRVINSTWIKSSNQRLRRQMLFSLRSSMGGRGWSSFLETETTWPFRREEDQRNTKWPAGCSYVSLSLFWFITIIKDHRKWCHFLSCRLLPGLPSDQRRRRIVRVSRHQLQRRSLSYRRHSPGRVHWWHHHQER